MATLYIGTAGNDTTGVGSAGNPWLTMEKAWASAANGDTIRLLAGTYTQASSLLDSFSGSNRLRSSIIIENDSSGTAIVTQSTQNSGNALWRLRDQVSPTIRSNPSGGALHFQYTGTWTAATTDRNMVGTFESAIFFDGGTNVLVDGIWILSAYGACIRARSVTDMEVKYCDIAEGANGIRLGMSEGGNTGVIRPHIHHNKIHDQHHMMAVGPNRDDNGAAGICPSFGTTGMNVHDNDIYECWSSEGSDQYKMDGGAIEPYQLDSTIANRFSYNRCWNNHGFMEFGTQNTTTYPTRQNGNIRVDHNLVFGYNDYQHRGFAPAAPTVIGFAATTPLMLLRANPGILIDHNTFDVYNGSLPSGGIRMSTGGGFSGAMNNIVIRDNVFRLRHNSHALVGQTQAYTGFQWHHNVIFRTTHSYGTTGNVGGAMNAVAYGNPTVVHTYSSSGLTGWKGRGFGTGDLWGTEPDFVAATSVIPDSGTDTDDADARDYHPDTGSILVGAASDGGDIGALPGTPTNQVALDDFNRTATTSPSAGSAQVGGAYITTTQGSSTVRASGTKLEMVLAAAGNTVRASLPSASATDFDIQAKVQTDKLAVGSTQSVVLFGRQFDNQNGYGAQVIFNTNQTITGNVIKLVANSQSTLMATATTGLTHAINTDVNIRLTGTGINPTVLKMWVWQGTMPTLPTFTAPNDSTPELQVAGGVGVRSTLGGSVSNVPVTFLFDDLNGVTPNTPSVVRSGDFDIDHPASVAWTGKKNATGGAAAISHSHLLAFTGTATFPAPQGRLVPIAEGEAPVGTWNRTDADAVDDDPDAADTQYVALAAGTTGTVSWRIAAPGFALDATADAQVGRAKLRNPSSESYDYIVRVVELVAGAWVEVASSGTQSLAGGASVVEEVTFSKGDLDDDTGANVGITVELL